MFRLQRQPQRQSGFTLIEVLVSLSIFTFVSVAAIAALLVMIDANRKAQNTQTVMTNLSFALESMTREIRTGTHYYCTNAATNAFRTGVMTETGALNAAGTQDCAGNGREILAFNEAGSSLTAGCAGGNRRIAYRYFNDRIQRNLCNLSWVDLTANDVEITDAQFSVSGSDTGDDITPTVTVFIVGQTGEGDTQAEFAIQTTVAQYQLDL